MAHRVFVTGGSGFVGSAVIGQLLSSGHSVHALVNRNQKQFDARVRAFQGSMFDAKALDRAMEGCDAAIHLVGIIMEKPSAGMTFRHIHYEGTASVVDAAKRSGIRRFIQMSALGARAGAVSEYHQTKFLAEQYIQRSGLEWTIFRPSLIHGPAGEFMRMEAQWARGKAPPFLFMPYFGAGLLGRGGAGMLQPIYVSDVAKAFIDALDNPKTIGEIFMIGGPDRLTWPQLHRTVAQAVVGKRRAVMALPAWYAKLLTAVMPRSLLPFNRDQVIMSQEDNTCDLAKFKDAFGWDSAAFEATLQSYASQL